MDDMRRKDTLSPQNVPSTICTAKRPHVYDMRRKTSTRVRFAVRTFCGVTEPSKSDIIAQNGGQAIIFTNDLEKYFVEIILIRDKE
jgi:hypothetical protein